MKYALAPEGIRCRWSQPTAGGCQRESHKGFEGGFLGVRARPALAVHVVNGKPLCGFHSPYDAKD